MAMAGPMRTDFSGYRGDTFTFGLKVWQDDEGTIPANFDGAILTAQVRTTVDAAEVAADFDIVVAGNVLTLTLPPKRTRELGLTNVFDIQCDWDGTDTNVTTLLAASLGMAPDVTRNSVIT